CRTEKTAIDKNRNDTLPPFSHEMMPFPVPSVDASIVSRDSEVHQPSGRQWLDMANIRPRNDVGVDLLPGNHGNRPRIRIRGFHPLKEVRIGAKVSPFKRIVVNAMLVRPNSGEN